MGRHVDTSWYDTYEHAKALKQGSEEQAVNDPELAGLLNMKPKTWARVKAAGRFLDDLSPPIERERIHCGYAPVERLAKLWTMDPKSAEECLGPVLDNRIKLPELDRMIREHLNPGIESASSKHVRSTPPHTLFKRVESYFDSSKLHPFDAYGGRCLRRRGTLGAPNGYQLFNAKGELACLVLCIKSGGWRDPSAIAREIYEHALSQRDLAPAIWLVFERDNVVLRRLAELSLYWGGSPYDEEGHWLYLSHFTDSGSLDVLFEDHFAKLIPQLKAGNGLIGKAELFCRLEALDGQPTPEPLPLRPLRELPEPNRTRSHHEAVKTRIMDRLTTKGATDLEKRAALDVGMHL
tara:strand:- start:3488 stop:4537 length:1050 start_codon:yes stop_codon:yes gene_type:complete